ncbi:hypothetical protein BC939DRAFT_288013 [Gamsiella multidivaricata]|uniref:uncharacterized protein n=1 Tax=Gamsiella multidivaricata TaxID=101098 RepID=UPI00221E51A0|nr:uncharacterized protein BC939DRAFT_288013 [Gamsiella multidivaricata]KAI7818642.1 hypothetical protein BC939DRAFT_288013 [Gamsiella multidivaricata]
MGLLGFVLVFLVGSFFLIHVGNREVQGRRCEGKEGEMVVVRADFGSRQRRKKKERKGRQGAGDSEVFIHFDHRKWKALARVSIVLIDGRTSAGGICIQLHATNNKR